MTIGAPQIAIGAISETVALFVIYRLWSRWRRRRSVVFRVAWSMLLLIPLLGPVLYFFLTTDPDEHPYDSDTTRDAAEEFLEGGGNQ